MVKGKTGVQRKRGQGSNPASPIYQLSDAVLVT